ncbi:RING finger protein narya-like [Glossina fuscipes]|uniref:RING finger protein narya-like n=1 Tax=Glossina fuscipes TaxID=7396 RepID=A0A8U0WJA0_9MUSC|nr:RING finger protein narya-like [Glossina fuscipes]
MSCPFSCNKCFGKDEEGTLQLHLSRCGHIICQNCLGSNCAVCSRPVKSLPISAKMPREVAEYFIDPLKYYQKFKQIAKFHREQQRLYAQHYIEVQKTEYKKLDEEMQGFSKLEQCLQSDLKAEREKVRKCKEQLACFERRLENGYYEQQPQPAKLRFNSAVTNGLKPFPQRATSLPTTTTLSVSSLGTENRKRLLNANELGQKMTLNKILELSFKSNSSKLY